jgi:hypothetical protein
MSRYRQQDCLSSELEFSDGKLKQKGYFIVQGSVSMRLLLVLCKKDRGVAKLILNAYFISCAPA